jgi:hypothetical protein
MPPSRHTLSGRSNAGIISVLVAFLVSGCTFSSYLSQTAVDYNRSIETSSNALILLNVLRASEHHPLYFSSISVLRGSISATVGGTVSIPFGGAAITDVYSADPTISVAVNPTTDIVPLNTQEFMRALMTETTFETFAYFWNHGWDPTILLNVLVAKITIGNIEIINHPERPEEEFKAFQRFVTCAVEKNFKPGTDSGEQDFGPVIPFKYDPKDPNSATLLIKGLTALVAARDAGLTITWDPDQQTYQLKQAFGEPAFGGPAGVKCDVGFVKAKLVPALQSLTLSVSPPFGVPFGGKDPTIGDRLRAQRPRGKMGAGEKVKECDTLRACVKECLKDCDTLEQCLKECAKPEPEMTFQLRSADAVLQYLGAVVRSKTLDKMIFRLHEGRSAADAPSVAVRYQGRVFHVSTADADTMRTLSLVARLLAINTSASALPSTPSVIRVGPQGP